MRISLTSLLFPILDNVEQKMVGDVSSLIEGESFSLPSLTIPTSSELKHKFSSFLTIFRHRRKEATGEGELGLSLDAGERSKPDLLLLSQIAAVKTAAQLEVNNLKSQLEEEKGAAAKVDTR